MYNHKINQYWGEGQFGAREEEERENKGVSENFWKLMDMFIILFW